MVRNLRRYGVTVSVLLLMLGLAGAIVYSVVGIERRRAEYDRYIYKALDYCNLGHMEGVLVSLTAAKQLAKNDDDIEFADDLIRRFRRQDCSVPTRVP